jgi:hypothetical protein
VIGESDKSTLLDSLKPLDVVPVSNRSCEDFQGQNPS